MKKIFFGALIVMLISINASAASMDDLAAIKIPSEAEESINAVGGFSFYEAAQSIYSGTYTADFKGVLKKTLDMLFSELANNVRLMAAVTVLGVICTFISGLRAENKSVSEAAFTACYSVLAGLTAAGFSDASQMVIESVENMQLFTKSLVPALTSMAIAEGRVISAPLMHTQVLTGSVIAAFIVKNAVLPLVYASFAIKFINNLMPEKSLGRLSGLLDKICRRILSFTLLIFTAMLTLTNFAAGTADNLSLKTARFALSTAVPVAGGALADTVSSLAASASMIKSSAGAAGIMAIAAIGAYPVIKCAAMSFLYNFSGAVLQPVADERFSSAVGAVGECMGMLFAVVAVSAALYVIATAIMISAVKI